jgi:tRNA wybutosine-synthesizing protein 2
VERKKAEAARAELSRLSLVDIAMKIEESAGQVYIPLKREPSEDELASPPFAQISLVRRDAAPRSPRPPPFQTIAHSLEAMDIDFSLLPRKWELLGDILLLPLPDALSAQEESIARVYANELGASTVAVPLEIVGQVREQRVRVILGERTETTHRENGIKYKLDAARLMFSSGNMDERIRMAGIGANGEVVVDMFAGIGYFTLPVAVYCKPSKVISYELNPLAHGYLLQNISLNEVDGKVEAHNADNMSAEEGVADRVLMGYLRDTHQYLDKAISILRDNKGMLHYHENCPNELIPARPEKAIRNSARGFGRDVEIMQFRNVKSYAPGVSHVVIDARIF